MWLLTCDGDALEPKSIWLRPGTKHLLGRTSLRSEGGERIRVINHKSVSRKHLTIEVGKAQPGDSSRPYARSELKVTDGSKVGTTLNGELLKEQTKILDGTNHTIKLGLYEHLFHITWRPVILSIPGISKKTKDSLAARRRAFEQTDIKLITDYVSNETTHLISKKRNTPTALQALLQARWLVTDSFVDSLEKAVVPDASHQDKYSLLEQDFDANWPKELDFLVPSGVEPYPRPDSYLKPNPDRAVVFQDYTFVFLAQSQYDQLLPVITAGGGKALVKDADPHESTVAEVVEYIKEIAGRKGSHQFRLSQQNGSGGIVVVRLTGRDDASRKLWRGVDLALDQRSVEQNEFLDAILVVDASGMRRQLPEETDDANVNVDLGGQNPQPRTEPGQLQEERRAVTIEDSPPAQQDSRRAQPSSREQLSQEQQTNEMPSAAPKKRNRRIITQSRFKGFDDFDPSQFARPASGSPDPPADASQASESRDMDIDEPSQASRTQRSSRKRPAPAAEVEEDQDMYEAILTSHTAMKRQKLHAAQNGETDSQSRSKSGSDAAAAKGKRKAKEMDVMAEVQALRKQQEEQRKQNEESLRQVLPEGVDINDLQNLAIVEEMEIPVRERPARTADENGASDRWDPAWNGRKNFKKFRRHGEGQAGPRLQRVIVTLEEVPRKGHGIGDEYWLNSSSTSRSNKSKSQSQSQNAPQSTGRSQRTGENEDDDAARFRRRLQKSREDEEADAAREVVVPEEIAGRPRDEGIAAAVNAARSQTVAAESQRKAFGKRPAASQIGSPAKKPRQSKLAATPLSREVMDQDEDDEDELKFRRRTRR